jgi:hypothetical protein
VSGVMPELGAGQSDYAMANAYMDYFAAAKGFPVNRSAIACHDGIKQAQPFSVSDAL